MLKCTNGWVRKVLDEYTIYYCCNHYCNNSMNQRNHYWNKYLFHYSPAVNSISIVATLFWFWFWNEFSINHDWNDYCMQLLILYSKFLILSNISDDDETEMDREKSRCFKKRNLIISLWEKKLNGLSLQSAPIHVMMLYAEFVLNWPDGSGEEFIL